MFGTEDSSEFNVDSILTKLKVCWLKMTEASRDGRQAEQADSKWASRNKSNDDHGSDGVVTIAIT
jgi:hypothetical protein